MKKTWICIFLVLALLLTACGSAKSNVQGSESVEADETETLQLGEIDGTTYTNATLGLGCMLEGWAYATRDQIAELNNLTMEAADDNLRKQLQNADTFMDMYAQTDDMMQNINVNFENISAVYGGDLSEQSYVDLSYPQMQSAMEQMGMTDVQVEKTTVVVAGTEHPGLTVSGVHSDSGVQIYQRQACVKCGAYMAIITVSSYVEDHTAEPFDLFFELQ